MSCVSALPKNSLAFLALSALSLSLQVFVRVWFLFVFSALHIASLISLVFLVNALYNLHPFGLLFLCEFGLCCHFVARLEVTVFTPFHSIVNAIISGLYS